MLAWHMCLPADAVSMNCCLAALEIADDFFFVNSSSLYYLSRIRVTSANNIDKIE